MGKHLPIGGSTASRTISCPAWVERAKKLPKPPSNKYADEGNLLHDAMEEHYKNGTYFLDLIDSLNFNGITLEYDHVHLLNDAKKALEEVLDEYEIDQLFLEPFVEIIPDLVGGSIDVLGISADGKTMLIADYKFGQGYVDVNENAQLSFYALAAMTDPKTAKHFRDCERIVHAIIQPKLSNDARLWIAPATYLQEFKEKLFDAIENNQRAETGQHCQYCPAAPVCPERKQQAKSALLLDPSTAEDVAEAFGMALDLEVWINTVKRQAEELALSGVSLKGFKLVQGKSNRRLTATAEEEILLQLGSMATITKLKTLTQLEKILGKGVLEEKNWVEKPDGALIVVRDTDKREAVTLTVEKNLKNFVDKVSTTK